MVVVVKFGAMAQALARYDEFAAWYEQWIADARPLIASHPGLLPAVVGERVLDMACGQGRMSRHLAGLGAEVVGVDISAACSAAHVLPARTKSRMSEPTLAGTPGGGMGGRSTAAPASWR